MKKSKKHKKQTKKITSVSSIIEEIEARSGGCDCIYRGQPEYTGTISSSLYREFANINSKLFNLERIHKDIIKEAGKHHYKTDEFDILTDLHHSGGKTNLIDFTSDYLIALFFACYGTPNKNGKVIVQKTESVKDWILNPQNPRPRVSVQKIVFVIPPQGYIKPRKSEIITVPANLKQEMLQHLRTEHNISTETVINDLHSFIRDQDIQRDVYIEYYRGLSSQESASKAKSTEEQNAAYVEAVTCYTKAIELNPDFLRSYVNRGTVYCRIGDVDRAIDDYNAVIKRDPIYAEIYYHRAAAYVNKGDFDKAIVNLSKEIELNPSHFDSYCSRGIAHGAKGNYASAIKDLSKVIDLNPKFHIAYYIRGVAFENLGKFQQAIQDFSKVIEFDPSQATSYRIRGNVYVEIGEHDKAINDFTKAIELNPDEVDAYNKRGIAYGHKTDHDRAIQDFEKALELNPDTDTIYVNLGLIYYMKGDSARAIENFDNAIELNPENANAIYNRGEVWLNLHEWEKARADLTTAKDLGADIIASFRGDYESVADFEKKHNIKLPADIAALLTPSQP